eukprot:gene43551-31616_t
MTVQLCAGDDAGGVAALLEAAAWLGLAKALADGTAELAEVRGAVRGRLRRAALHGAFGCVPRLADLSGISLLHVSHRQQDEMQHVPQQGRDADGMDRYHTAPPPACPITAAADRR